MGFSRTLGDDLASRRTEVSTQNGIIINAK